MTNRIKTLLEYGTPEWRSDLKLALLTLVCCVAIIIFFGADNLLGAVILRGVYFRYGTFIAVLLVGLAWLIILKWADTLIAIKLIGVSSFIILASLFSLSSKLVFLVSYTSGFVLSIGLVCFIPAAIISWLMLATGAVIKKGFKDYLTEPLLIRMIIICCLIFTACYVSVRFVQSLDFTVIDHRTVASENYYTINFTSVSSDISGGIVEYKCNEISILCHEISSPI